MKKLLTLLLTLSLVASLFIGCGSKEETAEETSNDTTKEETTTETKEETTEEADVVTTASIVTEGSALIPALSADGAWLAATLNDIEVADEIVVDGQFENREVIDRKLALYTQDEDHNITAQFTLTAPKMTVKSENFRITGGTFKGDVYVEAPGFKLDKSSTVDGNIYFASKELMDSFVVTETSKVTGQIYIDGVDVVTTASITTDVNTLVNGLKADGFWLVAALNNMTTNEEIVVDGEFIHREEVARKLALYTQDEERNVTASFTLTAPKLIVKSENFKLQGGTFVGDVIVEANGFHIVNGTVEGNVYFTSQEYMDSMVEDETGSVTGEIAVQ